MFCNKFLQSFLFSVFFVATSANANLYDKPTLTIYSYNSFISKWGPGEVIKQGFEAQCDCQLNIVTLGDGVSILNRLRLEGNKTSADVILGLDNNLLGQAKQADIVTPHQITKPNNLNTDWWDEDFIPYDFGYFAFIYNKEKIKSPPHSLHELVENKANWKIIYQDPRTSTPGLGLLFWVKSIYGNDAVFAWQKIAKNTVTVTKGWSEAYGMFLKGEADFVLSYSTSPVAHIINDQDFRYNSAVFDEGHYRQVEIAGMTKYSQQPQLARRFLQYLLTPEVQQQFAEKNVMYPIISTFLPPAFDQINKINKALEFDAQKVADNQKAWVREWQSAISQ
ncbi:thiamine ABC transporter substrate binding subunit [Gilliamella sp. B2776]|uniref:thiamine ABC transporter substrate binding subunit n=1 Tax=unclassified Gilliamella TaxID=2685620 RepID=UPI00226A0278|nr:MULTISPECIES: thiamine ABC transporter substrate binding subunit [unclassified Gilliamella]MCX8650822.1 thiamine ABC transporter substrate binding subunit [Gilliamella sp. B2779]MCX8654199.1 thiamine ABC transporter substrate binding subunit [Gilliamella sp. B2737]MCX8692634.1 thiamine ABC transporter substrate binding subunit [Gilliamella sp. B2776]MCX8703823.1 thiamine ABC transporter substrate binding subunit [Gilliamella sp. B2781]WDM18865.1 thiamine ABC transporter substrate binding su